MKPEPIGCGARAPTARTAGGFTLLEMLLVLAILAVVLGGGLGLFASLDAGKRQAAGQVKSVLRSAQNSAIARQAPARVRLDRSRSELVPSALFVIGTWQFEKGSLEGALELGGTNKGGVVEEQGFLGDALSFGGKRGAFADIPVEHDPAYDFSAGFLVECAVRREETGAGRLLAIGESIWIDVSAAGELRAGFLAAQVKEGLAERAGRVVAQSAAGALAPSRWTRLSVDYDRARLAISVDGVLVAIQEDDSPVWRVSGPLRLSDPHLPFPGAIDALVIATVVTGEPSRLPESVRLAADSPTEIRFDAGGRLDRSVHPGPVRFTLEYAEGTSLPIAVGVYGTVE
jgi:prepilin-type N-terminal cleavage/methylation domain-containing protein